MAYRRSRAPARRSYATTRRSPARRVSTRRSSSRRAATPTVNIVVQTAREPVGAPTVQRELPKKAKL